MYISKRTDERDNQERFPGNFVPKSFIDKYNNAQLKRGEIAKEFITNHPAYTGTYKTRKEVKDASPEKNDWILHSIEDTFIVLSGSSVPREDANKLRTFFKEQKYVNQKPIRFGVWEKEIKENENK